MALGPKHIDMPNAWIREYFESFDKQKIFYRFFPDPSARHTLLIIHGYGEHSGRYEKFATALQGIAVQIAIMDLRGMGLSPVKEGNLTQLEQFLKDITAFTGHLQTRFSQPQKFILLGHSLGGLLAILWALRHTELVKCLILSAPFLGLQGEWFLFRLNDGVRRLLPRFVYHNPVHPKSLSHDPAEVASYRKDPLIQRKISARFVHEIVCAMRSLRQAVALEISFPLYLMTAGDERIVDPVATEKFFDRIKAPHKEHRRFEGFFHEIFNEKKQAEPLNVLRTILEDCV